jgi:hypothetical protein
VQFALKYIDLGEAFAKRIVFCDEKKFCLFDSRHGRWISLDGEDTYNIARHRQMTDEEYRAWVAEHAGERLPHSKARGMYPWFVWGAVGFNKKSELYFLDEKQTLTADLYLSILRKNLLPVRKQYGRSLFPWSRPTMYITQDNDPKHYNSKTRAFFKAEKIELVGCHRYDINGNPDRVPGPGGHLQEQTDTDRFAAYRSVCCIFGFIFQGMKWCTSVEMHVHLASQRVSCHQQILCNVICVFVVRSAYFHEQ